MTDPRQDDESAEATEVPPTGVEPEDIADDDDDDSEPKDDDAPGTTNRHGQ